MIVANERWSTAAWRRAGTSSFLHRGHPIFERVDGPPQAPALLLIHGFPTSSWDWESVWDDLARDHRVFAPDLIGFGFSAKPPAHDYRIADQADLLEALLRHHGVQQYHVLAHDYGDTVAQELLARQDEPGERPRLLSLALLNGGLFPETHRPVLTQRLLLSPLGPWVTAAMRQPRFDATMQRVFGARTPPDRDLLDGFWTLMNEGGGRRVMHRLIRYMVERREHRGRWVGALQRAALPLLLIDGLADPISGAHMVARFRELVPQAQVAELPGIGHYPQCEAPQQVLAAYRGFRAGRAQAVGSDLPTVPA